MTNVMINESPLYDALVQHLNAVRRAEQAQYCDEPYEDDLFEESSIVGYYQFFGHDYVIWGDPAGWYECCTSVFYVAADADGTPTFTYVGGTDTVDDLLPAFKIAQDDAAELSKIDCISSRAEVESYISAQSDDRLRAFAMAHYKMYAWCLKCGRPEHWCRADAKIDNPAFLGKPCCPDHDHSMNPLYAVS